jgi:predicted membrane channel-forming protein YqfA (hemolysin III family)
MHGRGIFHLWERLPFHTAIWHAFVIAAAACHYVAVLGSVALTGWVSAIGMNVPVR